jgi:hypothetical protein
MRELPATYQADTLPAVVTKSAKAPVVVNPQQGMGQPFGQQPHQ